MSRTTSEADHATAAHEALLAPNFHGHTRARPIRLPPEDFSFATRMPMLGETANVLPMQLWAAVPHAQLDTVHTALTTTTKALS